MWRINEIFCSLQGEGYHTGTPAVFVRFSGCNLHCAFCDTNHQPGLPMSLPAIIHQVMQWPEVPLLVLTGGEPSLFIDDQMIAALKQQTGKTICIETNGTHPLPNGIDWVTLSPKVGLTETTEPDVPLALDHCDELKVVYCGQDLSQYDAIRCQHRFLQPCWTPDETVSRINMNATVAAVLQHPDWRLSLQTHRILRIP